ncbi:hypothetical protein A5747_12865 [Mycobacterium sp. IS-836]|nr:hypothetical protein A5747_12865 [Mycobacterium sp. IS-836]
MAQNAIRTNGQLRIVASLLIRWFGSAKVFPPLSVSYVRVPGFDDIATDDAMRIVEAQPVRLVYQ